MYGLVNTDLTYLMFSVGPNMCMVLSTQISLTFCSLLNQTCVWSCQHRSHLASVLCRTKHVYGLVNTDLTYLLFSVEPNMCKVLSTQISDLTYLLFSVEQNMCKVLSTQISDLTYLLFSVEQNMYKVLSTQISLSFCSL